MAYPHDPVYLEILQCELKEYEWGHSRGLASDEDLERFRAIIEELRNTPPREWPEGTTFEEAMEIATVEATELLEHEQASRRKQRDLIEKARSQREVSV